MRVLIGDDHALFREGLRRLLEHLSPDLICDEAGTFEEICELCTAHPDMDLILTDLKMPGWPGFSAIRRLRELCPDTPVVVVSGSEEPADVRAVIEHGAAGYIPKASSARVMMSALNLIFCGGVYVPPTAVRLAPSETAVAAAIPEQNGTNGGVAGAVDQALLTPRQWEVFNLLRQGKSNKQIANELGLSEGTVKIHVTAILRALGVRNCTQAVISAVQPWPRRSG